MTRHTLTVVRPGPLTTVQDLGRPGLAALGVTRSGATDRPALTLANRLVGNPEEAAGLETTLGALTLRFARAATVAVTGAPAPVRVGERPEPSGFPLVVPAGASLTLDPPVWGLRSYVAVRGGIDVAPVLGSRGTDLLAGLGPPPLRAGDVLAIGPAGPPMPAIDVPVQAVRPPDPVVLRIRPGPRDDWFTADAWSVLTETTWQVTAESNRIGVRLAGPPLARAHAGELPSEGIAIGSVQVPPSGQPVLFLADHPVTGGYPVIAVLAAADLPAAAQLRPGDRLRLPAGG